MKHSIWHTKIASIAGIISLIFLWHLAALLLKVPVLLPGPLEVVRALLVLMNGNAFFVHIVATVQRTIGSFFIIFTAGLLLGLCAGQWPVVHALMKPLLAVFKAVPVMSVILLAFIWFSSGTVPIFSAFLMGFPVMFIHIESAVGSVPPELDEMTRLYGFGRRLRLFHLVIPSMIPSIVLGSKASLSMVWKVVIAAEVLTVPALGVGSRMQRSQINLDTAYVLAWTVVAILLTALGDAFFEIVTAWLLPEGRIRRRSPLGKPL